MASIKKDSNRAFWYACYRDKQGRQHTISTKIRHTPTGDDPKERAAKASENRRLASELANRLEEAERGAATEAHLRKILSDISERLNRSKMDFPTTGKFLNEWLESRRASEGTLTRYKGTISAFLDALGGKAALTMENITAADINAFVTQRMTAGRSASTLNTDLKTLNIPFNAAMRQGLILSNPIAAADTVDAVKEERHPFTPTEIEALLKAVSGTEWETAILFAAFAGLRLSDAVSIRWENIDLFRKTLTFRPKKTARKKRDLEIPLSSRLAEHLMTLKAKAGTPKPEGLLTPTLASKSTSGKSGLSMQFSRLIAKADIAQSSVVADGEKSRTFNRKSFHSLRHSFISRLEEKGIAPDLRMKLAGHTDARTHGRYTHTEIETLAAAIAQL